jgi:hypothetical protein
MGRRLKKFINNYNLWAGSSNVDQLMLKTNFISDAKAEDPADVKIRR